MMRVYVSVLVLGSALVAGQAPAAPAPVGAADAPLSAVPAQAPIVVHLKGVDRVRGRVKATMTAALPDFGAIAAAQIDAMFGQLFEGRKTTALSPNGPVFLAFLEIPSPQNEGTQGMAIILRANSYAAFKESFLLADERKSLTAVADGIDRTEIMGAETFLVDKKDYVVLTPKKEHAEALAKQYPGLDGQLPKELSTRLLDHDIGVFVNMAMVNKEYGDQIRQGREFMMTMLDQAGGQVDKNQMESAKKIYGVLFQVVLDGRAFVAGLDFRPEGIAIHMQAQVGAETDSGQALKNQKPSALELFGKLPAGQVMYTAVDMPPEAMKTMLAGLQGIGGADAAAAKAVEAAMNEIVAARGKAQYASTNYPPAGLTFQEFAEPARALAGTRALYQAFGEGSGFMGGMLKSKPDMKKEAEEFRGIKFDSVRLAWDLEKMAEMVPGAGDAMKVAYQKILGDGQNIWFGVDGGRLLTVTAKDWSEAKTKLEAFLDGKAAVGEQPAFMATRKQLPPTASMFYMMDAGPFAYWLADYMVTLFKAMPALPFNFPENVKKEKTDPAFIGAALGLNPERGSFDVFVPVTAIQEIRKVVMQMFVGN